MEQSCLQCRICSPGLLRQGESCIVQMRIECDGEPLSDFSDYTLEILLASARSTALAFGRNAGEGLLPVEIDDEGNVAFEITSEQTAAMSGPYFVEAALSKEGSKIITAAVPVFEIAQDRIHYFMQGDEG